MQASGPVLKFEQVPKNPERMPYATFGGAAAALPSGDVFIMGGCHDVLESVSSLSQCVNTSNSFVVFQPATGKVVVPHTTVAPATAALLKPGMTVPAPMFLHAMTVFEGKVYMAGGLTPLGLADFSDPLSPPFHKMAVSTLVSTARDRVCQSCTRSAAICANVWVAPSAQGATVLDLATMQWSLLLACEPAACAQRWFSLNMVFTSMGGFVSFPIDDGSDTSLDLVWFGGIVITQSDLCVATSCCRCHGATKTLPSHRSDAASQGWFPRWISEALPGRCSTPHADIFARHARRTTASVARARCAVRERLGWEVLR